MHIYIYISNSIDAYLQPLVSCCFYMTTIRQRKKDFGEIKNLMVGWVLWHINICRLFNAQIHFYVDNQFYLKQFSLA